MRWLLPTLTLPLVQGVWDTAAAEARGGCPSVYVYDLPQLWDVRVPLDELRNVSGKFVFGRPCDGGIPEEFDTDQYRARADARRRPAGASPPGTGAARTRGGDQLFLLFGRPASICARIAAM